jgi:hypothetical protein
MQTGIHRAVPIQTNLSSGGERTRFTARVVYKWSLLVVFPAFVAMHGYIYAGTKVSSAFAVYAMKLTYIPFILLAYFRFGRSITKDRLLRNLFFATLPVFGLSLVVPLILSTPISTVDYVADALGFAMMLAAVCVFYSMLKLRAITFDFIEKASKEFCWIISGYTLLYFIVSAGDKISITPELQIPMTIAIGGYFTPIRKTTRTSIWLVGAVIGATVLSQLREYLVIFGLTILICSVRGLILRRLNSSLFLVLGSIAIVFSIPATRSVLVERLESMRLASNDSNTQTSEVFSDGSLNQRVREANLMILELKRSPTTQITGKGFGATYRNSGVLIYYGERVHNAHSTPFVVYFRNGVPGLLLFSAPLCFASITLFSKNTRLFRSSLTVCMMYVTLLFNQYFYWGVQYGMSLALLMYCFVNRRNNAYII